MQQHHSEQQVLLDRLNMRSLNSGILGHVIKVSKWRDSENIPIRILRISVLIPKTAPFSRNNIRKHFYDKEIVKINLYTFILVISLYIFI